MGHEAERRSGCSPASIVLMLVVMTVLLGMVMSAGAGAVMFMRAKSQRAMILAEQARVEAQVARMRAEEQRARAEALATELQAETMADSTIRIGMEGLITLDGESIDLEDLKTRLIGRARAVTIEADPRCRFEHVAPVMGVCQEADVQDLDVTVAPESPAKK